MEGTVEKRYEVWYDVEDFGSGRVIWADGPIEAAKKGKSFKGKMPVMVQETDGVGAAMADAIDIGWCKQCDHPVNLSVETMKPGGICPLCSSANDAGIKRADSRPAGFYSDRGHVYMRSPGGRTFKIQSPAAECQPILLGNLPPGASRLDDLERAEPDFIVEQVARVMKEYPNLERISEAEMLAAYGHAERNPAPAEDKPTGSAKDRLEALARRYDEADGAYHVAAKEARRTADEAEQARKDLMDAVRLAMEDSETHGAFQAGAFVFWEEERADGSEETRIHMRRSTPIA